MKKISAIFFLYFLFNFNVSAQTLFEFEGDFEQLMINNFSKAQANSLLKKYNHLLFFFDKSAVLAGQLQGKPNENSLINLKFNSLYRDNIDMLLLDSASFKNQLGYLLAAATYDMSKIPLIENILKKTDYKDFWAACALITLQPKKIDPVIKTILFYSKDSRGTYLVNLFLGQESSLLEKFGLDSVRSENTFIRYIAIKSLSKGNMTQEKDRILRDIVGSQDSLKGWAIAVLAEFNSNNVAKLLQPYLNDTILRPAVLCAIANSSSIDDVYLLDSLIAVSLTDRMLLDALNQSSNISSQKKWLKILREKELPEDYLPFIERTKIIVNEDLYEDICLTIENTKNYKKIFPLFNYFMKRNDDKSSLFLVNCLTQKKMDALSRTNIIRLLRGRDSNVIKIAIPSLMENVTVQDVDILELLLEYKNFNYKTKVAQWLRVEALDMTSLELCNKYLIASR